MSESQIIALVGLAGVAVGALVSGLIAFLIASNRNSLEARIEICKYREKRLSAIREEIALFVSDAMLLGVEEDKRKSITNGLMRRRTRIMLALPVSNPHYKKLNQLMADITSKMMKTGVTGLGRDAGEFVRISCDVLNSEWNEIQDLLYKKKKKKYAKNK